MTGPDARGVEASRAAVAWVHTSISDPSCSDATALTTATLCNHNITNNDKQENDDNDNDNDNGSS